MDHPSFAAQFHEISSLLDRQPGLLSLFHLYLVTAMLQTPEPDYPHVRRFLMHHLDFTTLPGFAPPQKNKDIWRSIPVVLTSSGRAYIRYMISKKTASPDFHGLMPAWAEPLFDPAARKAVRTAARAARRLCGTAESTHLFCFPLTLPVPAALSDDSPRFQGKSLGLPLALGFAALLNHHPIPGTLAATGEITDPGDILPVAHLDLKKTGVAGHGFTALIHPSDGSGLSPSSPITCLPVSTLNQAYALFSLYAPESTENLMLLSACLNDPEVLAKNIGNLPCAWLEWITRHGLVRTAFNLGRTALTLQDESTGTALLRQSIDLCFSPRSGPTIQVMALLPISFLPDSDMPDPPVLQSWKQSIGSAATQVDPTHFSSIPETPLDETRHGIRHNPAAWFPFNYR